MPSPSTLGEFVGYSYLSDSVRTSALRPDGSGLVYRGPFVYVRAADGTLTLEGAPFDGGRLTPSGVLAHVTDRLGSVRAVLDVSTGNLLEKAAYSAYGEHSSLTSGEPAAATARRFRFTGQEDQGPDFGTPYTDFGARQYSPEPGRWLTQEPLSENYYGISPYAYCAGDPVNMVDREGLDLVLAGLNNSSVTFKTDLLDKTVDVGGLGIDWKGSHVLEGDELLGAALDIAGVADPSGMFDLANACLQWGKGDRWGAAVSVAGLLPYAGDIVKAPRILRETRAIHSALGLASFTRGNFRRNLVRATGEIPAGKQAHHILPQKFIDKFDNAGINVHDPKYGRWLDAGKHGKGAYKYNEGWKKFFKEHSTFTEEEALDHARKLMKEIYETDI